MAVLAALAALDAQQHALGVDIADLERDNLRGAQPGAVGGREHRLVLRRCCRAQQEGHLLDGSAEDYARIFGGSGRTGTTASTNCAGVAYRSSVQRSPPVRRRGSGACPDTRRSTRPCATTTSTHSVSPDSMSLFKPNPVEPPWYVTRMPGGVGGVIPRGVPLSRSLTQSGPPLSSI